VKVKLIQFEAKGVGELSLVEIEGIEEIRAQFERRRHVQQVRGTGTEPGGGLPGQVACPFEDGLRQGAELKNAIAQVLFKSDQ